MKRRNHFLLTLLAGILLQAGLFAPASVPVVQGSASSAAHDASFDPARLFGGDARFDPAHAAGSDVPLGPVHPSGSDGPAGPDGPFSRHARLDAKPFVGGASPDAANAPHAAALAAAALPSAAGTASRYEPRLSPRPLYLTTLRLRI